MKFLLKTLVAPFLLLAAVSCAESESDTTFEERQEEAFDLWMAKYHPDIPKLESGLYMEWISRNPSHRRLNEGYWMELNYTGYTIAGDIYASRSAAVADQLGHFSYLTHYAGEYSQYTATFSESDYTALTKYPIAQIEALALMHEGDSVRLYIPPKLGYIYGFSGDVGYVPTVSTVSMIAGHPAILELGLRKVVPDPIVHDYEQTHLFARDSLGILSPADSTAYGLYMKKLVEVPEGDSITKDSTVSVYYIGRFIDGFVFDTNIDSVAKAHNIYLEQVEIDEGSTQHYDAISYTPYNNSDRFPSQGVSDMLIHMLRGERAIGVMNSSLGYGISGNTDTNRDGYLQVPPYTPLIYEIYVEPKETDKE
ncbi:MAG: FKBP-type peptidyl-prolyl cis-trans isomerase [Rikenellaceae bacterium]|jgi:hypothetical protein|nr:FKBP-type peptidyl-prolyl cis-trans isomerase [Rikenellaceae bacterium]